jgi:hypothetical protein
VGAAGLGGLRLGTLETGEFSLANPGGGPDLIENAALVPHAPQAHRTT